MSFADARGWDAPARRRRAASLLLAAAIHALLLLLLLRLAPPFSPPKPDRPETVVMLPAEQVRPKATAHDSGARSRKAAGGRPTGVAPKPVARQPQSPEPAKPWVINPEISSFSLSPSTTQVASSAPAAGAGEHGAGEGNESGDEDGAGTGPGGVQLYWAKWYREPTHAEMTTYMPNKPLPDGAWGEIACRTVERWHVEDCVELGQSPPGSGLSRAMREASFQFLVRPPRINGTYQVGKWVRIRYIIYTRDAP